MDLSMYKIETRPSNKTGHEARTQGCWAQYSTGSSTLAHPSGKDRFLDVYSTDCGAQRIKGRTQDCQ